MLWYGIDILRDCFLVGHLDAIPRLENMHELDDADRIDDAASRERYVGAERFVISVSRKLSDGERTDLLLKGTHCRPWHVLRLAGMAGRPV
jgi:hypothetical protein